VGDGVREGGRRRPPPEAEEAEAVHWTLEGLRAAIKEEFGVDLCVAAIWVWLRKEGWRQKVSRPRHHAADAEQEEFKKNGGDSKGQPRRGRLLLRRGRFGTKPAFGKRWARRGGRPVAVVRPGYRNFYACSAVRPATGEDATLLLPWANTEMMNVFLAWTAERLGGRRCILVMDRAGWHVSRELLVPPNIRIVLLPPHSPELNPVERLWRWPRRHAVLNHLHLTLESVEGRMREAAADFFRSICRCDYLLR
jgi:hypothetical protein